MGDDVSHRDLLGDPWRELADPRGRKKHPVTDENRLKVSALRADGRTQAEIADAIGVSEPTLREYYFRELRHGAAFLRSQAMLKLTTMALGPDSSASWVKLLFARLDAGDTLPKAMRPKAEPKSEPKGKKEALRDAAESGHASTGWGGILPN